jgi:hypothetical protein
MVAMRCLRVRPSSSSSSSSSFSSQVRVCKTQGHTVDRVWFEVNGTTPGLVPVVVCGLGSSVVAPGSGLWVKRAGEASFTLFDRAVTRHTQRRQTREDIWSGLEPCSPRGKNVLVGMSSTSCRLTTQCDRGLVCRHIRACSTRWLMRPTFGRQTSTRRAEPSSTCAWELADSCFFLSSTSVLPKHDQSSEHSCLGLQ